MLNKIRRHKLLLALPLLLATAFACATSSGDAKTSAEGAASAEDVAGNYTSKSIGAVQVANR